jgi:ribosomal protein L12E/L44/L45/RPP1/RPP2
MAAMLIHAAGESSSGNLPKETRAIALETDEGRLQFLAQQLDVAEVDYRRIEEGGELFAIGITPMDGDALMVVKRATSSLPLIR